MDIWRVIIVVQGLLLIVLYGEIRKMQTIQRLDMSLDNAFKDWLADLEKRIKKIEEEKK